MSKCYRCGRITSKGRFIVVGIMDDIDEVLKEWYCDVCLDVDSRDEAPISRMVDEEVF